MFLRGLYDLMMVFM